MKCFVILFALCVPLSAAVNGEDTLRTLLQAKSGTVQLPPGVVEISREIVLPRGARDLDVEGSNTVLKAATGFRGRALLVIPGGVKVRIGSLSIDGNRDVADRMATVPPAGQLISRTLANNGILAEGVTGLEIAGVKAAHVAGFAIVAGSSHDVKLHDIEITESGGFNPQRRNNGAGGIVLEDGVTNFEVSRCRLGGIRGSGLTVRSSGHGRIAGNDFAVLARDAIEVDQSNTLVIEDNHARQIGAPTEEVSGRVECMRLNSLTDSVVKSNTCQEALLGAIVLTGSRNAVSGNRLLHINLAQKNEAGILLGDPAAANTIEGNEISGPGMSNHCIELAATVAKGSNRILHNDCSDESSVAALSLVPGMNNFQFRGIPSARARLQSPWP